jgi:uncharacterized protein with ATP-grasp and redox domains
METLNIVAVGQRGIVYTNHYEESAEKANFNITFSVTKDMAPETKIFVYYIRDNDGAIIYDYFIIELGMNNENFVKNFIIFSLFLDHLKPNH